MATKKEKTAARNKATKAYKDAQRLAKELTALPSVVDDVAALCRYEKKDSLSCTIEYLNVNQLKEADLDDWAYSLVERNMRDIYARSGMPFVDAEKRAEMMLDDSRYLVALDDDERKPLGLVHLRFEYEEDTDKKKLDPDRHLCVLYVYEIQLEEGARRSGLGRRLMQLCELVARKRGVDAIYLTVARDNPGARRFYERLKYDVDFDIDTMRASPNYVAANETDETRGRHYCIMRKVFPKARQ